MHRLYLSRNRVKARQATIVGPPVWHITKVLRLGPGAKVVAFDGRGMEYLLQLQKVARHQIDATVVATDGPFEEPSPELRLIQAVPKQKQIDFILQKSTEVGVNVITPVFSERSVPRMAENQRADRRKRWEQIVMDAAAQSGRVILPQVEEPTNLDVVLETALEGDAYLLDPNAEPLAGVGEAEKTTLFIGPEGGFSDTERDQIIEAGAKPISIGPQILRVETASIVALSLLRFLHGALSHKRQPRSWE